MCPHSLEVSLKNLLSYLQLHEQIVIFAMKELLFITLCCCATIIRISAQDNTTSTSASTGLIQLTQSSFTCASVGSIQFNASVVFAVYNNVSSNVSILIQVNNVQDNLTYVTAIRHYFDVPSDTNQTVEISLKTDLESFADVKFNVFLLDGIVMKQQSNSQIANSLASDSMSVFGSVDCTANDDTNNSTMLWFGVSFVTVAIAAVIAVRYYVYWKKKKLDSEDINPTAPPKPSTDLAKKPSVVVKNVSISMQENKISVSLSRRKKSKSLTEPLLVDLQEEDPHSALPPIGHVSHHQLEMPSTEKVDHDQGLLRRRSSAPEALYLIPEDDPGSEFRQSEADSKGTTFQPPHSNVVFSVEIKDHRPESQEFNNPIARKTTTSAKKKRTRAVSKVWATQSLNQKKQVGIPLRKPESARVTDSTEQKKD
jgi:hypothetical protein